MKDIVGFLVMFAAVGVLIIVAVGVAVAPYYWFDSYLRQKSAEDLAHWNRRKNLTDQYIPKSKFDAWNHSLKAYQTFTLIWFGPIYLTLQIVWIRFIYNIYDEHVSKSVLDFIGRVFGMDS